MSANTTFNSVSPFLDTSEIIAYNTPTCRYTLKFTGGNTLNVAIPQANASFANAQFYSVACDQNIWVNADGSGPAAAPANSGINGPPGQSELNPGGIRVIPNGTANISLFCGVAANASLIFYAGVV